MIEAAYKIIEDLLSTLNNVLTVKSTNIVNPTTTEIVVCDPLWAHAFPCSLVYNGGNSFVVKSMVFVNNSYTLTLSGSSYNVNEVTSLKAPTFYHGTTIATNTELNKTQTQIFPIVYLYEVLNETFFSRRSTNVLERESNFRLFFLTSTPKAGWTTDCHYVNAVDPMAQMAHLFIKNINNSKCYNNVEDYNIVYHAKFGNYDREGHLTAIFDKEPMSGVELEITIQKKKENKCTDC